MEEQITKGREVRTLSIILIIILEVLSGCSDIPNPVNSDLTYSEKESSESAIIKNFKNLIWKHDGISVTANGEHLVTAEVICDLSHFVRSKVLITFDGWTNADTTSYISVVAIESDGQTLFLESGGLYINRHHEFLLQNIGNGILRFYISLWCDEIKCNSTAELKIVKINIYKQ